MLFGEEISKGGSALGNFPQGFTAVSSISSAFNLDRLSNAARGSALGPAIELDTSS